jgi:hypothetical protein
VTVPAVLLWAERIMWSDRIALGFLELLFIAIVVLVAASHFSSAFSITAGSAYGWLVGGAILLIVPASVAYCRAARTPATMRAVRRPWPRIHGRISPSRLRRKAIGPRTSAACIARRTIVQNSGHAATASSPCRHSRCGLGGLEAAKTLRRVPVEVTIIDRQNYQPLLYQVATAALSPAEVA